jgi:3-isopropylmalate/(R)-2-methylmalate dehydratase large subunit
MIAPDDVTYAYLEGREFAPTGKAFDNAVSCWKTLPSDSDASFDRELQLDVSSLAPQVSWGTNPGMVTDVTGIVPDPESLVDDNDRKAAHRALEYLGLEAGVPVQEIRIDRVFIGSCTNSRIEDLRLAAHTIKGRKVASSVHAMVVPGSQQVKRQAELEGLDQVFKDAGSTGESPAAACVSE